MADTPEYFQLRPEVEKAYGYTHAVRKNASAGAIGRCHDETGARWSELCHIFQPMISV